MTRNICIIINKKQGGKSYLEEIIIQTKMIGTMSQWTITGRNFPKELTEESKVFVKANGTVKGYFTIKYIEHATKTIIFEEYYPIHPFKLKHFQIFKLIKCIALSIFSSIVEYPSNQ